MNRTPIPKKRKTPRAIHSERTGSHKRVRLYGAAKSARRAEIFERAGGRCEEKWAVPLVMDGNTYHSVGMWKRCPKKATEWSHLRHSANKCDCLDPRCSIASCADCHRKRHNAGGKPCPKKSH